MSALCLFAVATTAAIVTGVAALPVVDEQFVICDDRTVDDESADDTAVRGTTDPSYNAQPDGNDRQGTRDSRPSHDVEHGTTATAVTYAAVVEVIALSSAIFTRFPTVDKRSTTVVPARDEHAKTPIQTRHSPDSHNGRPSTRTRTAKCTARPATTLDIIDETGTRPPAAGTAIAKTKAGTSELATES